MTLPTDAIVRFGAFASWANACMPRLALQAFWNESVTGALALAHDLSPASQGAFDVLRFRSMLESREHARRLNDAAEQAARDPALAQVHDLFDRLAPVGRQLFEYGYGYTMGLRAVHRAAHSRDRKDVECPFCRKLLGKGDA